MKCVGNFYLCQASRRCKDAFECHALGKAVIGSKPNWDLPLLDVQSIVWRSRREQKLRIRRWIRRANV